MVELIIRFASLLFVSLVIGVMFGIWLGNSPFDFPPAQYIEQQQHAIVALNTIMPLLGATGILLTIASAVFARKNRRTFYLLISAIVLLIVAGLITRFGNQPINSIVMTWNAQAAPDNWTQLRDEWWRWHITRTLSGIFGLSLLFIAALLERTPSR